MFGSVEFTVESLSAYRAIDKLARAGIPVISARSVAKNAVVLQIAGKDCKKAFAILRGSCYNVKNMRRRGILRLGSACLRAVGLLAGCAVFTGAVLFFQSRILRVEISGSGAYYEQDVLAALKRHGVAQFSALPADTGALTAEILALPHVEFCSFRMHGGVLTVNVEVSDEAERLKSAPLLAPAAGIVEELVVVRGAPLVNVGDEVAEGQRVVDNFVAFGPAQRAVAVIAKISVRFSVSREYALGKDEALAQAFLDFGEIAELRTEKTNDGWLVSGTAVATAAAGLD